MTLPFKGLSGSQEGALFDNPLEVFDPTKDTDDLPGEDGSDERAAAVLKRIDERVLAMKESGEWDEMGSEFGVNPLANVPLWKTIIAQMRVVKPYDSVSEFALTYVLVLATTIVLTTYILLLNEIDENFIVWFNAL